jgi:hypothetical protein
MRFKFQMRLLTDSRLALSRKPVCGAGQRNFLSTRAKNERKIRNSKIRKWKPLRRSSTPFKIFLCVRYLEGPRIILSKANSKMSNFRKFCPDNFWRICPDWN